MRNNIIMLIIGLLITLPSSGCSSSVRAQERNEAANAIETIVCVEDSADNIWKEAYSTFLNDFQRDSQYNRSHFSWRDLDHDGIPELIIEQARDDAGILNVYSYDSCVFEVGKYSNPKIGVAALRFSTKPEFSGLFTFWWGGGVEHYGYLTVKDKELIYVDLWYIDFLNETNQIEVSSDKELINESISVNNGQSEPTARRNRATVPDKYPSKSK